MKRIGIIGAGRFGQSLAAALAEKGADILLIDLKRELIQTISEYVTNAVQGDATNARALTDAGFHECDTVVVAIGSNIEGSVMATVNCKELGIPNVVAKAASDIHGKVLKRVGADIVVYPNKERAVRLARALLARNPIELFEIADGLSVAEIDAPETLIDKTLAHSTVRQRYDVNVLAIHRQAEDPRFPRTFIVPTGDETIQRNDRLLVFGNDKKIDALSHS
ncbi:MAG: TrkA family potassium uptake protein [Lentisphaerae bacterium]|nr:TrkA family potassium uptake protein [Lentisphaerota bacterium]